MNTRAETGQRTALADQLTDLAGPLALVLALLGLLLLIGTRAPFLAGLTVAALTALASGMLFAHQRRLLAARVVLARAAVDGAGRGHGASKV